jgi:hypothetical protein
MLRRLAVAASCALALTVAGPVAAHAESLTFKDERGDVWAHFRGAKRAPNHARGDIIRAVIAHNDRQVVIRTKFVELDRRGMRFVVAARLRTSAGVDRVARLSAGPGQATWQGTTHLYRGDNNTRVDCAPSHRIDYAADVAVIRVPRTCLGSPVWVRATMGAASVKPRGFFADNPVNDGPTGHLPDYSTRIRRG